MKKRFGRSALVIAAAVALAALVRSPARAQGTAFTYQGSLDDAGAPASGLHDFRFRLYDAASGGAPLGSPVCADNVDVVDGVFSAQLDFGQQYATAAARYLEIEVRGDTGLDCADLTGFVAMAPRQQVTAAPMASHANSAFALDAADGSPMSAVFVDDGGNVGIGTTTPANQLHVNGGLTWGGLATEFAYSGIDASGLFVEHKGSSIAGSGFRLQASRAGDQINYSQFNIHPENGFSIVGLGVANSNLGIGTATPLAKLDVRGDIKLGSGGQYHAMGGEERLRMIRGRISSSGTVLMGSGFTASRTSAGTYLIGFSPSFPVGSAPAVTVSAEWVAGSAYVAMTNGVLPTATGVRITNGSGTLTDQSFYFTAIGPR